MHDPTVDAPTWDGRERRGPGRVDDEARARRLLMKYRGGAPDSAAARDHLVLQFRPLVQKQARQFVSTNVPFDDLVQEGFLGLMHGIDAYDPTRGVKLITYVTHHIDGHLRHYLRDRVQIIKEPAWLQEMALKVRREAESLNQELGQEPTDAQVAASLGLTEAEVTRIRATRSVFAVTSLEEAQETGGAAAHAAEMPASGSEELPLEDRLVLENALVRLKDIEQKVLYQFYYEEHSQTDIARDLNVSNNYISHILKNSARKLQQMFRSDAVREAALQHERKRRILAAGGEIADNEAPPSIVDPVTGLYTREYFQARLDEELSRARRYELELSVVRVRVSEQLTEATHFVRVAQAVKQCMRKSDLVARGDVREIVSLLPHTGENKSIVCRRLKRELSALQQSLPYHCEITLGAASFPQHRQSKALMSAADATEAVTNEADS